MADVAMPFAAFTKEASERLAPGSAIAIAVLVASTFTVILNKMLMVWPCHASWPISASPRRRPSG